MSLNTCIDLGLFLSLQAAKAGQGPGNVAYKLTYMDMFQGMRLKLSYHGNELHVINVAWEWKLQAWEWDNHSTNVSMVSLFVGKSSCPI